ncbi:hypothetical protein [Actinomadura sp. 9N407]|uniref:hypothetical protein n=1 Tax=Actinomadura sp. 9N407 TaxID=3375154 RepID=UPI0037B986A5
MVVAPSLAEMVQAAGGWLFDQVMAGWDVTVLTADHVDSRPLRILGARALDLEPALASRVRSPRPQAIALAADLYESDPVIRRRALRIVRTGEADLRLWGGRWPARPDGEVAATQHRLSMAARAFKAQALAATAAAPADSGAATETFRTGELLLASKSA